MNPTRAKAIRMAAMLCMLGVSRAEAASPPGTVVAWGDNANGQTNVPDDLTNAVAIGAGSGHSLAVRADGTVAAWGDNTRGQTNVPVGLTNVISVAGGVGHSLALMADRTVVAWGQYNGSGNWFEMYTPAGLSNVVAIAAGNYHSLALKSDGMVVAWGTYIQSISPGGWHQMYVPAGLSNVVAIAATGLDCLALRSDNTIVYWGTTFPHGGYSIWSGLTNVVGIAIAGQYKFALDTNGIVFRYDGSAYQPVISNILAIAGGVAITTDNTVVILPGDYSTPTPGHFTTVVSVADGIFTGSQYLWRP